MEPVGFPLTRTEEPKDLGPIRRGARRYLEGEVDVLLFTSPRGVEAFGRAVADVGGALSPGLTATTATTATTAQTSEVWVVGEETGRVAEGWGFPPTRMPGRFVAEGLVDALPDWGPLAGKRILFPRAAVARDLIVEALVARGAHVTVVEGYRSVPDVGEGQALWAALLRDGAPGPLEAAGAGLDAVAVTASSQVRVLAQAAPVLPGGGLPWPAGTALVALGPATAETAHQVGLAVTAVADPHTLEGLVQALDGVRSGRLRPPET
jgi:uroporphyrinogen III methyltransferase/synthase